MLGSVIFIWLGHEIAAWVTNGLLGCGAFDLIEYGSEQFLDFIGHALDNALDVLPLERDAQLLEDLLVESLPVADLGGQRVRGGIVMQFNVFGEVVMQQLGHHAPVRKVPVDVSFRTRERNAVHHFVDVLKLFASQRTHIYIPTSKLIFQLGQG